MGCVTIVQPAGVPIRVMWQRGRDIRHVSTVSNITEVVDWRLIGIGKASKGGMA